jgi:hypothetical protein
VGEGGREGGLPTVSFALARFLFFSENKPQERSQGKQGATLW